MKFLGILLAFLASAAVAGAYRKYAIQEGIMDIPSDRSSHEEPTPRGGGISFMVVWVFAALISTTLLDYKTDYIVTLVFGAVIVGLIGIFDDVKSLSPLSRIIAHFFAGIVLGLTLDWWPEVDLKNFSFFWGWIGIVCLIFFTAWSINLYNFMDGINGLASTEAITLFGFGGWFIYMSGGTEEAMMAWILAAGVAGFMVWNFPKAKVFMGDGGSGFLGFMVAAFATLCVFRFHIDYLLWAMLYSVFLFDATATLLRRMWRNEKWYHPHRSHAYQRLVRSGWSHTRVTISVLFLNLFIGGLATYAYFNQQLIYQLFAVDIAVLAAIYFLIEKKCPMRDDGN